MKYSQADVARMRKEWDLETRGRFLAKERDYLQNEQRLKDELRELNAQGDKNRQSVDDMKWEKMEIKDRKRIVIFNDDIKLVETI